MANYNGVVLGPPRKSVLIEAPDVTAAKAQMEKLHGPEQTGTRKNWVCGLAPADAPDAPELHD